MMIGMVAFVASVCSVASFYFGRKRAAQDVGQESGGIKKDIEYIKNSVSKMECSIDNITTKMEKNDEKRETEYRELLIAFTKTDGSVKSLHRRVDFLYDKLDIPRSAE